MATLSIKNVTPAEVELLQEISIRTFYETFSAVNTEENMKKYLEEAYSLEKLTAELTDENTRFFFATHENKVIGYLKLNSGSAQTELKEEKAIEIERIYVLQAYHGKAVGQILYETAIQEAKKQQADYVWLGVWEENQRAISFYRKNGFVAFDKHLFRLGNDEQTDIMMKLKLSY